MIEIKSFANIGFDVLFTAFEQAFAEYEVQQDKVQLQRMLKRRGFNPNLSFAAFEGDKIVAFTLNGIGNYYGVRTAYDTKSLYSSSSAELRFSLYNKGN
ncbi:hypothetical protein [Bacteroides sp.]|uniref:hypothetical protein n=1 Tax=Bacteroides sp. TaxID=29523 RepID=UPI00262F7A3D|nr:hypothetical protein [Bacteroides sp.]